MNKIHVYSAQEIDDKLLNGDLEVAKLIVNSITKNIKTAKKIFHLLEVTVELDGSVYDITATRDECIEILRNKLPLFECHEEYEWCINIRDSITYLNKNYVL